MNNLNFNIINKISNLYNINKLPKSMLFLEITLIIVIKH